MKTPNKINRANLTFHCYSTTVVSSVIILIMDLHIPLPLGDVKDTPESAGANNLMQQIHT
jgi:hypothetical protein